MSPMGQRVGWVDGDDLYLDSDAAYRAAQAAGEGLVVDVEALRQRLREAGLLASVDEGRTPTILTVRKRVEGRQRRVMHLHSDALEELSHLGDSQVTQGASARVTLSHLKQCVQHGSPLWCPIWAVRLILRTSRSPKRLP